ncbi:ER membrane protein complex subunit 3 [Thelohanellus kitauei]|uniref:ER membrane protein complex subunit 3 n=1 Tax=Thelohanellus kitauei TaxID=669202 RepID=A0A0C2IX57_THEKT|nr:ER membrane protein complex subunit 3 [Thelohanellus kitauei]
MLTIDPNIRIFVVIPLVFMNFCLCIIKAYALKIFGIGKTKDVMQSRTDQTIKRVSKLIENGAFIPSSAFEARRHFYNELDNGYLEKFKKPEQSMSTMFNDPNVLMGMMKNNMVNMMVMIVFGQWVNAVLSGYILNYHLRYPLDSNKCFKVEFLMFHSMLHGLCGFLSKDQLYFVLLPWAFWN